MAGSTGSKESGGMSADGDIQNSTGARAAEANGDSGSAAGEPAAGEPVAGQPAGEARDQATAKEKSRRAAAPATAAGAVLPNKAAEDDPRHWGDQPENYDHDAWLQEQKPPHWG
jgi:hypothetical protein